VSLKGHRFYSWSLIFSIVNQQVRLAGTPRYRLGSHMSCVRRWRPIFASTHMGLTFIMTNGSLTLIDQDMLSNHKLSMT
jgi:hypothetical protein